MNVRLERGGTCKTNKGEGGQKSKTGSLERTYFLNDPLACYTEGSLTENELNKLEESGLPLLCLVLLLT